MSSSSSYEPEALDRETLIVAGVVLLGAVMSILDITVVNVAINRLAIDFNASLTTIQWVVTGYTLAIAAVIPLTGWAADRFGTKRLYLTSLVLFVGGSILCGAAWSAGSLIGFRVLQGLGGGMIMPAVMTIMTKKAGPSRMGRVMGVLGVPMLIAPIAGPILGGWLVDDVSWRWIFFINVPIGIVAFIAAFLKLDRDEAQPTHRLDWLGMALLSPGLTLLIFGLAETSSHGAGAPRAWVPIAAGALLIIAFLRHSWTAEAPLIDIRTFTHTRAGAAAGVFLLFAIAMFGSLLLLPLYFQNVRGQSALEAGLLMAPQGFGAMITMPIAGRLTDRYGPTRLPAAGLPLAALGMLPFAFVTSTTSFVLLCGSSFVLGLGMGAVDDADDDRRDAGGPGAGDRADEHRDEHHPPVRRVDRDGDPRGDPHLAGLVAARRRDAVRWQWLRGAPGDERRPARGRGRPAGRCVRVDVRLGRRPAHARVAARARAGAVEAPPRRRTGGGGARRGGRVARRRAPSRRPARPAGCPRLRC